MIKTSKKLNIIVDEIFKTNPCLSPATVLVDIADAQAANSWDKDFNADDLMACIEAGIELTKKSINKKLPIYRIESDKGTYYFVGLFKDVEKILLNKLNEIRKDDED